MTEPTVVPGLQQWKDNLWEVNREAKSLLMLANITTVEGLVAYVGWHGEKEFEAINSPEDFAKFQEALATLKELLPSTSQIELVTKRKEELVEKRAALNQIKDMFL